MIDDKTPSKNTNTGGAYLQGDANTSGGDFIGRDKNIHTGNNSLVVEGSANFQLAPSKPKENRSILPPHPALFIGREEALREIKKRLGILPALNLKETSLLTVRGWPGVGKTTLVSALAHDQEVLNKFPDGILWVALGSNPSLFGKLATWGRALGADTLLQAHDISEVRDILAGLLQEKRVLLIVDDVWKIEHAQPFLVGGEKCAVLFTTRINAVARSLSPPEQIYLLPGLSDNNGLKLLHELTSNVVQEYPRKSLELVQALEGLPLAIQVAGRLLEAEQSIGFGVNDLIEELKSEANILEAEAPPDRANLVNEITPTVAALLYRSLESLDEVTLERYAYLGAMAPKPATFDFDAMKFMWEVDNPKPSVRILEARGLLEYLPDTKRYQMHALLVMLAKTLLE